MAAKAVIWAMASVVASFTAGALGQCFQLFEIEPDDSASGDYLGADVAVHGSRSLIAAPFDDDFLGSVYVYDTGTGNQIAKLLASDGESDDAFGRGVAANALIALIGAPGDDDRGMDSGSVYAFDATTGVFLTKFTGSDSDAGDKFGRSVALCGTIAIVGAPEDRGTGNLKGSVYVFDVSDPQTPVELSKFGQAGGNLAWGFGTELALSEKRAVVAISELDDARAFLIDLTNPSTPQQLAVLQLHNDTWWWEHRWGTRVGISDKFAIVGTYKYDYPGFPRWILDIGILTTRLGLQLQAFLDDRPADQGAPNG